MMLMIMTINHLNNDRGGGGAGDNCLSSLGWLLHHLNHQEGDAEDEDGDDDLRQGSSRTGLRALTPNSSSSSKPFWLHLLLILIHHPRTRTPPNSRNPMLGFSNASLTW